jgi:hypothetical protein
MLRQGPIGNRRSGAQTYRYFLCVVTWATIVISMSMMNAEPSSGLLEEFRLLDLLTVRTLYSSASARVQRTVRTEALVCRGENLHYYSVGPTLHAIKEFSCEALHVFLKSGSSPRDSIEGLDWLFDRLKLTKAVRPAVAVCSIDSKTGLVRFCGRGNVTCSLHRKHGAPEKLTGRAASLTLAEDHIVTSLDGSLTFVRIATSARCVGVSRRAFGSPSSR